MLAVLVYGYLLIYYLRPAEWVPGLLGAPLQLAAGILALSYLGLGACTGRFPHLKGGESEKMMWGLLLAIWMSHLSHFYFGGMLNSFSTFLPTITGFLLIVCYTDSRARFNRMMTFLVLLTAFLAYQGWLQETTGAAAGGLGPLVEGHAGPDGESVVVSRVRWYGVFNDPNDLGLSLVAVLPYLFDLLLKRRFLLPLLTLPVICASIYFTNSRGTVLAGIVGLGSYFIFRYRSLKGAAIGAGLAVAIFLVGPSRMGSISASEESAYGRIDAWYQAYLMFMSNPVFGVGQGMFTDYHPLTAHNSFVLVMAELGFFGLFFFIGVFYFPYTWLLANVMRRDTALADSDLGQVSAVFACLTGMLVAMFFISRAYVLVPYVLVALNIALIRILAQERGGEAFPPEAYRHGLASIFKITVGHIVLIYLVVKVLL